MTRLVEFERDLRIAIAGLSPPAIAAELARTAHEALAEVIGSGEASERYERFVNGKPDVPEEAVVPPGPIIYAFDYQAEIAQFALDWARANSPVLSGAYRDAWFILADGSPADPKDVQIGQTLLVTNDKPYARKIEVGAMKVSVPPLIVERMRQAVRSAYPFIAAEVRFIALEGGYVLKRSGGRRGRRKGDAVLYPALEIVPQ